MPVVHQHGQYSPLADKNGQVAHMEILSTDQRRVENLRRRVSETTSGGRVKQKHGASSPPVQQQQLIQSSSASDSIPANSSAALPASSGSDLKTGNYVVAVGLGTPSERFTVDLDTGSDMVWVQCKPCMEFCHRQAEPLFNPANSSTYANIPCASPNCSVPGANCSRAGRHCVYEIHYQDYSYTQGYYSHDTLILGQDTIQDFRFGCSSKKTWGLFGWSAGVMGLGRGKNSLTMQAYHKYKGVFAYCLPADPTGMGFLHFGPGATPAPGAANARQTPMLTNMGPTFYYVALTGIKVGGHLLPVQGSVFSAGRTLIDSGTVITRLPPSAYRQLRSAFAADMGVLGYSKAPSFSFLDTCFNLTGLQGIIPVPTVSLLFRGGATLDVDSSGILYAVDVSHACLAFAANGKDTDVSIIGSTQQKTYSVLYDVGSKVVGFAPGAC
ncbi:aspartyl protease family protein At5g10770-like [Miscanthus floridulus]|uniref:aspartyl protease family protein At5g10770-like n=1 Tax=Miscanthus floridulus TaxID=154761 RepID=UPI0034597402